MDKPEDDMEDIGVDGRIMLIWIFRKRNVGHWLDRCGSGWERWRSLVNARTNIQVLLKAGNVLTSLETVSF